MMTTNITFKTTYDIPMDEMRYQILEKSFKDLGSSYQIDYDEDFQQAHICCVDGDWLEQTPDCYIFTERRGLWRYIINKSTGEISDSSPYRINDDIAKDTFADALNRVYGTYDRDFIDDELKGYLRWFDNELADELEQMRHDHELAHALANEF